MDFSRLLCDAKPVREMREREKQWNRTGEQEKREEKELN